MRLLLCQDCTSVELRKMWCMAEEGGGWDDGCLCQHGQGWGKLLLAGQAGAGRQSQTVFIKLKVGIFGMAISEP